MANLTKIILGLNILAAGAGIFFGITKSGKTGELMDSVATAKGEASKATSKLIKLESEKAAITKQFTEKDAEHKAIKAERDQLASTAGENDAEFANLQQANGALNTAKQSWSAKVKTLEAEVAGAAIVQDKLAAALAQVQTLTAKLNKFNNPRAPKEANVAPVTVDGVFGQITDVDKKRGTIVLNRGSAHGCKVKDQFNVFRDNKLIGRVEVTFISPQNPGLSIAQRTDDISVPVGAQFKANDNLVKFQ